MGFICLVQDELISHQAPQCGLVRISQMLLRLSGFARKNSASREKITPLPLDTFAG
jgi:hypothetical protein